MCHSVGARKLPGHVSILAYGDETCNDFDLSENDSPYRLTACAWLSRPVYQPSFHRSFCMKVSRGTVSLSAFSKFDTRSSCRGVLVLLCHKDLARFGAHLSASRFLLVEAGCGSRIEYAE